GHAAQGDGEVCGTAIETRMRARTTPRPRAGSSMCLGVDSDLHEATRKAVRGVVDWLEAEKALSRADAYMLVSIAGNLRMCEVVDMPNYAIGCAVPLGLFVASPVLG
ncbi:hypothetical protein EKO27_g10586, partial [Xylaria grammica]